jgi:nucleoid DNA-binding protein
MAQALTAAEFKEEVAKRLGDDISKATVNKVFAALVEEAHDCLVNGYVVTIPGLVKLTPAVKPGRKKGTVVKNPFAGTEKKLKADEPDKFVLRVSKSSSILKKFPKITTARGKELHGLLADKPREEVQVVKRPPTAHRSQDHPKNAGCEGWTLELS